MCKNHPILLAFFFLMLASSPFAIGFFSSCSNVSSPGEYHLEYNISGASESVSGVPEVSNACFVISSDDVLFDCVGYAIQNDGTGNAAGIVVNGSTTINYTNVTIRNCENVWQYEIGVYLYNTSGTTVRNVTVHNNTWGVYVSYSDYNNITDGSASNNSAEGHYIYHSSYNLIRNNTVHDHENVEGIYLLGSDSTGNTVINNTCYDNYEGIGVSSAVNNSFSNNTFYGNEISILLNAADQNNMEGNVFHDNSYGIYLEASASYNTILNNNFSSANYAIYLWPAHSNNITGNDIFNHSDESIFIYSSDYNLLENNTMRNNSYGAYIDDCYYSTLTNNTAYGNDLYGFYLYGATQTNMTNNTAYDNLRGFYFRSESGDIIVNSTAYGNTEAGIYLRQSDSTISNSTIYNNTNGLYLYGPSNPHLYDFAFYNNYYDLYLNAPGSTEYNASNLTFLNPQGEYVNYTSIDIYDHTDSKQYSINWSATPSTAPTGKTSFANRHINISYQSGTPFIAQISWRWTDYEATNYDETIFELWKFNGTEWSLLNNTPDSSSNKLTQYNMYFNDTSVYGIYLQGISDCTPITSSGDYLVVANLSGAPNSLSTVAGTTAACVIIASSDVTLNCNGRSITNDGTSQAVGIAVNGSTTMDYTNVTIRNCPKIYGYVNGIQLYRTAADTIRNTSASGGNYGIYLYGSQNNTITNNTVHNNSQDGIYMHSSFGNNVTANTVHSQVAAGIALSSVSTYNNLSNNVLYNNSDPSFYISLSSNNTIYNNTAYNTSGAGIYIFSSSDCNLTNNTVYDCTSGIELNSNSMRNNISGNRLHDNSMSGIWFQSSSSNNTIYDTPAYNNAYGIFLLQSHDNNISATAIYNNSDYGFYMASSYGNRLTNSSLYENGQGVYASSSRHVLDTVSFLPIGGESTEYSTLSLTDANGAGAYRINWSASPGSSPSSRTSFESKYVNITTASGTPNITSIEWSWQDSEASGYDESTIELWKYNASGWTLLNDTPDTTSNTLTQYSLNPASIYGLFYSTSGGEEEEGNDAGDYECITSSDCPECYICSGHECVLPAGSCASASDCSGSYPFYSCEDCSCNGYECNVDSDCDGEGYSCESGECVPPECLKNEDCAGLGILYYCGNYECLLGECYTSADCLAGYTCTNYFCIPPQCFNDDDCEPGKMCENYVCVPGECRTNADCDEGFYCGNGVCERDLVPGGPGTGGSSGGSGGSGGSGSAHVPTEEPEPGNEQVQQAFPFLEGDSSGGVIPDLVINEETRVSTGWIALFFIALAGAIYFLQRRRRARKEGEE
ncbi:right-handed parallel beta-helix repeat-containing protein [Candidatus Micrarchaeota archaeon]|nr:right-handed parallel beta-helix repeat-containing protein [Candidatus Micrarchaeota archaeon]